MDFHHTFTDTLCLYILPHHAGDPTAQPRDANADGESEERVQAQDNAGIGEGREKGPEGASEGEAAGREGAAVAGKKDNASEGHAGGIDFSYRKCLFGLAERHGIQRGEAEALLPFVRKERERGGADFTGTAEVRSGLSEGRMGKETVDELGARAASDEALEAGSCGASMEYHDGKGDNIESGKGNNIPSCHGGNDDEATVVARREGGRDFTTNVAD